MTSFRRGPQRQVMALVTFTCGLTVTILHRYHIPGYLPATLY